MRVASYPRSANRRSACRTMSSRRSWPWELSCRSVSDDLTIGTRLSGVPEIVRDGETGFVVPTGDAGALAERLELLLKDAALRERFGAAAHEYVGATFTIEAMVAGGALYAEVRS